MNDDQLAGLREITDTVLAQAQADSTYLAALRSDPEAVLVAAGMPAGAARQVAQDEFGDGDADTAGHRPKSGGGGHCNYTCDSITCIVTWCSAVPYSN